MFIKYCLMLGRGKGVLSKVFGLHGGRVAGSGGQDKLT